MTDCFATLLQALDDDEMMRQYAELLARQDSAREDALKALQARTAMRAEVAGLEVLHLYNAARQSDIMAPCHPQHYLWGCKLFSSNLPCTLRWPALWSLNCLLVLVLVRDTRYH